jgi:hypothetical protein
VLHFATHGTLAGEIEGTSEPGLILTPPKEQTDLDDGYLSASELAALKLDADWVILSACNTAAGGRQGRGGPVRTGSRLHVCGGKSPARVALGSEFRSHRQPHHQRCWGYARFAARSEHIPEEDGGTSPPRLVEINPATQCPFLTRLASWHSHKERG